MPESVDEFAARIKTKYPEYADKDNSDLVGRWVKKYPEYADKVSMPTQAQTPPVIPGTFTGGKFEPAHIASAVAKTLWPVQPGAQPSVNSPNMPQSMVPGGSEVAVSQPSGAAETDSMRKAWSLAHVPAEMITTGLQGLGNLAVKAAESTDMNEDTGQPNPDVVGRAIVKTGANLVGGLYDPVNLAIAGMTGGLSVGGKAAGEAMSLGESLLPKGGKLLSAGGTDAFKKVLSSDDLSGGAGLADMGEKVRSALIGQKNKFIIQTQHVVEDGKALVPDKTTENALNIIADVGNNDRILKAAANPMPQYASFQPEIERAAQIIQNPTPETDKALTLAKQYYSEAGAAGVESGAIKNLSEKTGEYVNNRYYEEVPSGENNIRPGGSNAKMTTTHGKQQIFANVMDAADAGKRVIPVGLFDGISMYGADLGNVVASRNMAKAMTSHVVDGMKLAEWAGPQGAEGLEPVGITRQAFGEGGKALPYREELYAPPGMAKALRVVTNPDTYKAIEIPKTSITYGDVMKAQGAVKTGMLAFSAFHPLTFIKQAMDEGHLEDITNLLSKGTQSAKTGMRGLEQYFVERGGETAAVEGNMDVLQNITKKEPGLFSDIMNKPGVKQAANAAEGIADLTFKKMQRNLKVMGFGHHILDWMADNPNATKEEMDAAASTIARHVNNVFGGQNWADTGWGKNAVSQMRMAFLAPDWLVSNAKMVGNAAMPNMGLASTLARKNLAKGLLTSAMLTEELNYHLTGHYTDHNPKGHKNEVQTGPNTYFNFYRGAPGEVVKLMSMMQDNGPKEGITRYLLGKTAPIPSAVVGDIQNMKYGGSKVSNSSSKLKKFGEYVAGAAAHALPIGVQSLIEAYKNTPKMTPANKFLLGTGITRYSKSKKKWR